MYAPKIQLSFLYKIGPNQPKNENNNKFFLDIKAKG